MIVFFYDGTFEGLLTVIFESYVLKKIPDQILAKNMQSPLLITEIYEIKTDELKADRVFKALKEKISKDYLNKLLRTWLMDNQQADEIFFQHSRKLFSRYEKVSFQDILEIRKAASKVSKEAHQIMGFARFQKNSDGIYFSLLKPMFNVLPLLGSYFKNRFGNNKWFIYDEVRNYGLYGDGKKVINKELAIIKDSMDEEEKLIQKLWQSYFKSVNIAERANPTLQRNCMPRRFWPYLTEMQP